MALTDAALRALKAKDKRYEVLDGHGLLIEVHPSGRKVWRYRYTMSGRREKVMLGTWPAISLAEARRRRAEKERMVEHGQSPAQERKREREIGNVSTVAHVAERWIEEVLKPANRNARQDETYVRRDILPAVGHMDPSKVSTADVRAIVDRVLNRGHGQAARRVRSVLKRLFDYARGLGVARENPAMPIRPTHVAPTRSRSRILAPSEIASFVRAVETSRLSRQSKLALRFLLLVPCRKSELVEARREHFDVEAGTWDIPVEASKNGAPIRHRLPRQALDIVRELLEADPENPWLMPSTHKYGTKPVSKSQLNGAVKGIKGWPTGMVIHDLRRTIRTGLSELGGIPTEVAEMCLNHRPTGVAAVYDRSERIEERAVALQRWADHVDALLLEGDNVTALRRGAAR